MTELSRYRRRPDPIEAVRFHSPGDGQDIARLFGGRVESDSKASDPTDVHYRLVLPSLRGDLHANVGDWVTKNVDDGTLDVCTDEAFRELYEEDK